MVYAEPRGASHPPRPLLLSSSERERVWDSPQVLWQTVGDRSIQWVSDTVSMFGYSPEEMVGADYGAFFPSYMADEWRDEVRSSVFNGKTGYFESVMKLPDGSLEPIAGHARPMYNNEGDITGFQVGFSRIRDVLDKTDPTLMGLSQQLIELLGYRVRGRSRLELQEFLRAATSGRGGYLVVQVPSKRTEPVEVWKYGPDSVVSVSKHHSLVQTECSHSDAIHGVTG